MTLKLEIVTPETKIYSEDVDMVTLPGSEGELGVYPRHVPLLTTLKPGELRVLKSGRETAMAIGEGFVEIKADAVSVLTDMALESAQIDLAAAEAAVAREGCDERRSQRRRGRGHPGVAAKGARPIARQAPPSSWVAHVSRGSRRCSARLRRCKHRTFSGSSPETVFIHDCLPIQHEKWGLKKLSPQHSQTKRIRRWCNMSI